MTLYLVRYFQGDREGHRHRVVPIYDRDQAQGIERREEPLTYRDRRTAYHIARRLNQTEQLSMEGDFDGDSEE